MAAFWRRKSSSSGIGFGGRLDFLASGFTTSQRPSAASLTYGWEGAQTNDTTDRDGYLAFSTTLDNTNSGAGGSERMRITSEGDVGIGTATPGARLHIESGATDQMGDVVIRTFQPGLQLVDKTNLPSDMNDFRIYNHNGVLNIDTDTDHDGAYETNRLTILTDGKIGIGTANPSTKLEVNGTVKATSFEGPMTSTSVSISDGSAASPSMTFSNDSNTGFYSSGADSIGVSAGGTQVWNITSSGIVSPTLGGASMSSNNGTAATPTFSFSGDEDTGWFRPAADTLAASTAGVERVRINSSGYLGIGTTDPQRRLHVRSDGTYQLRLENGSAGGGFWNIGQSDNGFGTGGGKLLFIPDTDTSTGATVTFTNSGRVGIGTSAPVGTLDVNAGDIEITGRDTSHIRFRNSADSDHASLGLSNGGLVLSGNSSHVGNEHIYISNGGRVGIGTTNPITLFEVEGGAALGSNTASPTARDHVVIRSDGDNPYEGGLIFANSASLTGSGIKMAQAFSHGSPQLTIGAVDLSSPNTITTQYIHLAGGRVGIGTANPGARLDVNLGVTASSGYMRIGDSADSSGEVLIGDGTALGGAMLPIFFGRPSEPSRYTAILSEVATGEDTGAAPALQLTSRLGTSAALATRPVLGINNYTTRVMTIDADGDVGIGYTNPLAPLHVNGSIVTGPMGINGSASNTDAGVHLSSSGYVWAARNNAAVLYLQRLGGTGSIVRFYSGSTGVGSINTDGTSTSYSTTSDYRLKENITPMTNALDRLMSLPTRRFNYKSNPGETIDGFIAHEVAEVVPEAVTGEKDAVDENGDIVPQMVDYSKIVPLVTGGVQELYGVCRSTDHRVDRLSGEVDFLRRKLATVENENEELKARLKRIEEALGIE